MKFKRLLWILVLILFIVILFQMGEEPPVILPDGTYENCYMISLKENKMTVLAEDSIITIGCPVGEQIDKMDKIVDIQVENNQVTKITWKEGQITDKIEAVSLQESWMTLKTYGKKNIAGEGRLYIKTGDNVRLLTKAGSLLNHENVSLYIHNDEICAVIVTGDENLQTIRVLLHGDIEEIYHEEVRLTASESYKVTIDGATTEHSAGEEMQFTRDMGLAEVTCENGKIRLLSAERASGYPEYRGSILIYAHEEGYIVCNEVKLEEYLYSVVSSEMPASYHEEALKAQAVCARTYAIYQMQQAYYGRYGAHVDDTVNSQVYNNVNETESTIKAVNDTTGQYLSYDNQPICAYFYSTSCGTTSDVKDVWISNGTTPVYLKGRFQGEGEQELDLSVNGDFYKFLTEKQENCFEKEEAWFRWAGTVTYDKLTSHVEKNLDTWIKENPSTYQMDGNDDTIGKIIKVQVSERSPGGVIKKLCLIGETGTLTITGEYQIRKAFCPEDTVLTLNDGSTRTCSMLPSGYFAVENKENIVITGGGYGHGVGLSQNGARAMAEQEYSYEEILGFYYPETALIEVY